ncbi:MAG: domain S-box [Betaproteobacteria bacterium]|nr:domain S-box [Betaproteobacteria bacterium]
MSSHPVSGEHPPGAAAHSRQVWPYRRSPAMRYGVAVLAVLAAFTIRYAIYGDFQNRLVFTFFVPAAVVAVWYGGVGPGIVATALGLLLGDYFFMMSRKALWPLGNREALAVGVYIVTTLLCVLLCERLHRRIRQFERALDNLRQHGNSKLCPEAEEFAAYLVRYYALPSHHHYEYPSWPYRRSFVTRYGVAIGVVAVGFVLRYWLFGPDSRFPFLFFVPAAIVAVWFGGIVPGLVAAAAGLMLGDYFFLSDHEALGAVLESERMQIGMFAVTTTLCVMLLENLHERVRRLEHAFDRATHHQAHAAAAAHGVHPASAH